MEEPLGAARPRLGAVEKIARDICWYEFPDPSTVSDTKAAYWQRVHPDRKDEYVRDAEKLIFWLHRLPPKTLTLALIHTQAPK